MMRRWLLISGVLSIAIACVSAQPKVTVQGTLKGYFLTPQGELVRRSIILTSREVREPSKEKLHLLWAGYYFEGLLMSKEAVIGVRIFLGDTLIYLRHFPKPTTKVSLPDWNIPLRIHPRYGFPPIVEVEGLNGWKKQLKLQPANVKILHLLPLKVDWTDFVRIELIRQFLKREGEQLLPLPLLKHWLTEITFVIQGENGQIVWINPPKAPKGSKRYAGPSPVKGHIYYSVQPLKITIPPEGGVAKAKTVYLSYRPNWYILPEVIESDTLVEPLDNLLRLEVIFHETIHAVVLEYLKKVLILDTEIQEWQKWWNDVIAQNLYNAAYETIESLYGTLSFSDLFPVREEEVVDRLKTFLAIRWHLRNLHPKVFRVFSSAELVEGVSLCLQRLAVTKFINSSEGQRLKEIDPFLKTETEDIDETFATSLMAVQSKMAQCGAYALKVSEKIGMNWRDFILTRLPSSVDDLLTQFISWRDDQEKIQIIERVKKEKIITKSILQEESCEEGWQLFRDYLQGKLVKLHIRIGYFASDRFPSAPKAKWKWLPSIEISFDPAPKIFVQRPVLVSDHLLTRYLIDFCVFLEPTEVLLLRRCEGILEVKGKGVTLYVPNARILMTRQSIWLLGSLEHLSSKTTEQKEEVSKMQRSAWFVFPLAFLLAAPAASQYMADQTLTCTVSGLFHDALTGQQQYLILDLIDEQNNPPGDWHCIAGETYIVQASWTSPRAELAELTLKGPDGTILGSASADPPTNSLQVSGQFQSTQSCTINIIIGAEINIKQPVTGKITGGIQICLNPPEQGTIKVVVQDMNTGNPINPPYKVVVTKKPSGPTQVKVTDSSGVAVFPNLSPGDYIVTLEGINNYPACKWTSEVKLKKRGFLTLNAAMAYHQPIEGKIKIVSGPGGPDNITVKAVKSSVVKYGEIDPTPDPNGYYRFRIPISGEGGIPEDGVWTVIVECINGSVSPPSRSVTVPRHCSTNIPGIQPPYGPHTPVDAGVFEVQFNPQPPGGEG